jgi:hypothetical protein
MSKKLNATEKLATTAAGEAKVDNKAAAAAVAAAQAEAFAGSIVQQLDVLSVRREQWEATDYKKANDGLYALLADCLGVFQARFVKGTDAEQKALRSSLMQRLQADGVRVVKTSTTLTMLARYVFNSDRKRAQGYGNVLAAAVSHGVDASGFAAWVVQQGGLEEIKRLMVKKPEAVARQAAVKTATVAVKGELELNTLQPLAHVGINGLTGNYAVLLAKPNVAGGVDIVGSLSEVNDALVNALVLRMAKQQVDKAAADAELGRQVAKEQGDLLAAANDELNGPGYQGGWLA